MASGWPRANGWKPEEADLDWTNRCPSHPQMEQATWQGSGSATQGCGERSTAHSLWSSLGGRPSWRGLRDESTEAGRRGGGEAGSPWSAPPSGTCLQVLGPSSARPQAPHVGHCLPLLKPKARVLHGAGRSLRAGPEGYTSRRMWRSRRGACDAALRNLGFRLTQEPSGTGSHSQPGSQLPTAHPGNSLLNREWDRGRGWSWRSWLGPV